jgi:hypothetical protein
MRRSRNLLSIVLVGLLFIANTACACANAADIVSDDNPHAHHQMQDTGAEPDSTLCAHEDCEDCLSIDVSATPEKDTILARSIKLGVDGNDFLWIEVTAPEIPQPTLVLASAGPPYQKPLTRTETPVLRADLLLE